MHSEADATLRANDAEEIFLNFDIYVEVAISMEYFKLTEVSNILNVTSEDVIKIISGLTSELLFPSVCFAEPVHVKKLVMEENGKFFPPMSA